MRPEKYAGANLSGKAYRGVWGRSEEPRARAAMNLRDINDLLHFHDIDWFDIAQAQPVV